MMLDATADEAYFGWKLLMVSKGEKLSAHYDTVAQLS